MAALPLPWPGDSLALLPDAALRCDRGLLLLNDALLVLLDWIPETLLCLAEPRPLVLSGTLTLAFRGRA